MPRIKFLFPVLLVLIVLFVFSCPATADSGGLLTLPAGLVSIESEAFMDSAPFDRVIVPEGANRIGSSAFAGTGLKQIQLPVTMNEIADDAFGELKPLVIAVQNTMAYGWANGQGLPVLACTLNEGEATIVSYNGSLSTLYLPDEVMGCPVTAIASTVFRGNTALECVVLPESLTAIDGRAFTGCSNLRDVVFNDCLTSIEYGAFENCTSLLEADLPDSVQTIRYDAFRNCTSLNYFDYPLAWENTSTSNDEIFKSCSNLKSIIVPEGVTTLPVSAFSGANLLESVILPSTLTSVPYNAFYGCSSLKSIELPDSVHTIGEFAFSASGLETIVLPESLTTISRQSFSECRSLTDVEFNESLTFIGQEAFMNSTALIEADLPDSVQTISGKAFSGCTSLESFRYPAGWTSTNPGYNTEGRLFYGCTSLKSVTVPAGITALPSHAFDRANYLESITLPDSLTAIPTRAFAGCTSLKSIEIPDAVETICEFAFSGSGLETVALPKSLTTLERQAFSECKSLTDIGFNDCLTTIGYEAFMNSTALIEADLPDSVQTLSGKAFYGCTSLESFRYPAGWTSTNPGYNTEGRLFYGCTRLKSVIVPEGTAALPSHAFDRANYLENVSLPASLTALPNRVFAGCISLKAIEIPDAVETICEFAFSGSGLETVSLPDSLTTLERQAFSECKSLTDIEFNDSLTSIGYEAFMNSTALIEADLPDSVQTISGKAFYGCTALESFHYPSSWAATNNDGRIFEYCSSLQPITVPEGVTTIPGYAFARSTHLETVNLPSTLTTIPSFAFSSCSAMGDIYIYPRVSDIHDWAFNTPGKNLRILCEWGTTALSYAKKNSIPYYYLSRTGSSSYSGFYAPSGTIYQGDDHWMYGYVRGSIPVTNITATLYDADGEVLRSVTVEPNVTDYNAGCRALSGQFDFGNLELGSYSFRLTASTEETTETLVYNHFTVKEPPLRINDSGIELPGGVFSTADTLSFSGVIHSNYVIDRLTVTVSPVAGSEAAMLADDGNVLSWSVVPNSFSYDLAGVELDLSELGPGHYAIRITILSHSTAYTVAGKDFYLWDYENPEDFDLAYDDLANFLSEDNSNILSHHFTYEKKLEKAYNATLNGLEKFAHNLHYAYQQAGNDVIDGAQLILSDDLTEHEKVQLYKTAISNYIKSSGAVTVSKSLGDVVSQAIIADNSIDAASLALGTLELAAETATFLDKLDGVLDIIDFSIGNAEDKLAFAEYIGGLAVDYDAGIIVLNELTNDTDPKNLNHDFQKAVSEMKTAYARGWEDPLDELTEELAGKTLSWIGESLTTELIGFCTPFKLITLADTILEKAGVYEGAEGIKAYSAEHELYSNARDRFRENFKTVYNGDHSEEAIARLLTSFNITRSVAIRELDTALQLDSEFNAGLRQEINEDLSYYRNLSIGSLR